MINKAIDWFLTLLIATGAIGFLAGLACILKGIMDAAL